MATLAAAAASCLPPAKTRVFYFPIGCRQDGDRRLETLFKCHPNGQVPQGGSSAAQCDKQ